MISAFSRISLCLSICERVQFRQVENHFQERFKIVFQTAMKFVNLPVLIHFLVVLLFSIPLSMPVIA